MNFFKRTTSWSNAEFVVFKLAIASAYILIGAFFHHYIRLAWLPILFLFLVSVVWTLILWIKKMKQKDSM